MKLYEINEQIIACIDNETGEIIDTDKLNELQIAKDEKLENLALWYKDLIAEANALKEEKEALQQGKRRQRTKPKALKTIFRML